MRAAIFNPYLDTLGGGERYTVSFAEVLAKSGWKVDIEWKNPDIKKDLEKRFGMNLYGIDFVPDIKRGEGYDLCFWISDGSIPLLHARRNFLHFQVPFKHIGGNNLINKMKLIRVDKIICNSVFTKKIIDKEFGVESIVIYPPVDTGKIKPKRKQDVILSVARFSRLKQTKGQEILIESFKKMTNEGLKKWKLILAGGIEVGVGDYIEGLEKQISGYPIEIVKSPDFKTIKDLYGGAKIFWSASGYGENEEENPEKVEHFGITVVESMSAGCVPIVFAAGGHKEIIDNGIDGYLWHNIEELELLTKSVIKTPSDLAKKAILKSKKFSYDEFRKNFTALL